MSSKRLTIIECHGETRFISNGRKLAGCYQELKSSLLFGKQAIDEQQLVSGLLNKRSSIFSTSTVVYSVAISSTLLR